MTDSKSSRWIKTRRGNAGKTGRASGLSFLRSRENARPETTGYGDERGFTLLEVMVALSVVAIALVILLETAVRAIDMNAQSHVLTQAAMAADNRMANIEASGFPELGDSEIEEDPDFPGYFWKSSVQETPFTGTRMIRVSIYSDKEGEKDLFDLTYYVLE